MYQADQLPALTLFLDADGQPRSDADTKHWRWLHQTTAVRGIWFEDVVIERYEPGVGPVPVEHVTLLATCPDGSLMLALVDDENRVLGSVTGDPQAQFERMVEEALWQVANEEEDNRAAGWSDVDDGHEVQE